MTNDPTPTLVSDLASSRPSSHAHRVVRDMAWDMAHQLYATMMSDNEWYSAWKRANPDLAGQPRQLESRFVARNMGRLLPQARAMIAGALGRTTDPALADQLYEALCLDATLTRGRPGGGLRPLTELTRRS